LPTYKQQSVTSSKHISTKAEYEGCFAITGHADYPQMQTTLLHLTKINRSFILL